MTILQTRCPHCGEVARFPIGDTAPAVQRAITALAKGAKAGKLSPAADALATMAVDLARAFDVCSDDRAMAAMAKELRATLDLLEQRAGRDDTAADPLADRLSAPVVSAPGGKLSDHGKRRVRRVSNPQQAM